MPLILAFELLDDPGTEHEHTVKDVAEARQIISRYDPFFIAWADVTDEEAHVLADTEQLL